MDGGIVLLAKYLFYLLPFVYLQLVPSAAMIGVLATHDKIPAERDSYMDLSGTECLPAFGAEFCANGDTWRLEFWTSRDPVT